MLARMEKEGGRRVEHTVQSFIMKCSRVYIHNSHSHTRPIVKASSETALPPTARTNGVHLQCVPSTQARYACPVDATWAFLSSRRALLQGERLSRQLWIATRSAAAWGSLRLAEMVDIHGIHRKVVVADRLL